MSIYKNTIGVEISPSALRIASLSRRKGSLYLSAAAQVRLCYRDFDDLYKHPKTCADTLNDLCHRNGIQSGDCIAVLPAVRGKSKCIALPLMRRRILLRMLSNRHFWYKHLGVCDDTHSYAWLTTVHDEKQYRLSLYLMAVSTRDLSFYKSMFAYSRLSLSTLTFSSLVYYGMYRRETARRLLILNENDTYLAHIGRNVFSHQPILSNDDCQILCNEKSYNNDAHKIVLRRLSESLQECLRSEKGDKHTLHLVGNLNAYTKKWLSVLPNNIIVKPLDICADIKLASEIRSIPAEMLSVIALARWAVSDSAILKREANFIRNCNTLYYKSAACWLLSTIVFVILFFYNQHVEELNAMQHPQLQGHVQLSLEYEEYKKKLTAIEQQVERHRQLHAHLHFLSEQHHLTMDLWSHLSASIPQSINIESIECHWNSVCLITAETQDYGEIIHFAEQIEQLDKIDKVVINNSRTARDRTIDATQFTLSCKIYNEASNETD